MEGTGDCQLEGEFAQDSVLEQCHRQIGIGFFFAELDGGCQVEGVGLRVILAQSLAVQMLVFERCKSTPLISHPHLEQMESIN